MVLLAAPKERSCELANEVAGAAATTTMRLLALLTATKQGSSKLTDKITRPAAMATAVLLVTTHECIHGKAPEPASPVSSWTVDTARASNFVGRRCVIGPGVGVCGVGGRAVVGAATDGRLARGQVPLRHAGADLNVYSHVSAPGEETEQEGREAAAGAQ